MRRAGFIRNRKRLELDFWPFNRTDEQFGRRVRLFEWRRIVFTADRFLLILFPFLVLTLRYRLFPYFYFHLSSATYWGMALLTAMGIVLSVLAHEIVHLAVAQSLGEKPHGVFLYLFGTGTPVELSRATMWKRTQVFLAGVVFNLALSLVCGGLAYLFDTQRGNVFGVGILFHLGAFNLTLALFQLLPVLPLDGGNLLLSWFSREGRVRPWVLLAFYGLGLFVSLALFAAAGFQIYANRPILAAWLALVGLLLLKANYEEYEYLSVKSRLEGLPIKEVMSKKVVSVDSSVSLSDFTKDYVERYPFNGFPVVWNQELAGYIHRKARSRFPSWRWQERNVSDVASAIKADNTVSPDTDSALALSLMVHGGNPRLLVSRWKKLVGIVTYGDLIRYGQQPRPASVEKSHSNNPKQALEENVSFDTLLT